MMIVEAATILPDIRAKDLVKYLKAHPDIVRKLISHWSVPEKIASFDLEIISFLTNLMKQKAINKDYSV